MTEKEKKTEFHFEGMTPALKAYRDHCEGTDAQVASTWPAYQAADRAWNAAGKPDGALKEERQRLHDAHFEGLSKHREKGRQLRKLVEPEVMKAYKYEEKKWICRDETAEPKLDTETSPCGKYRLIVSTHRTGEGTWPYTRGRLYNVATGELIATLYRNYASFNQLWATDHPDGHSYFLGGQDYQGLTLVQLDTGAVVDYLPEAAEQGTGWCWVSGEVAPGAQLIALAGCYWACPFETIIYDFSKPMDLPWVELHRDPDNSDFKWTGPQTCEIGTNNRYLNIPGHPLHGKQEYRLTVEEEVTLSALAQEQGIDEEDFYESRFEAVTWHLPPAIDSARRFIVENLEHKRKYWPAVDQDLRTGIAKHLARLSPEERAKLRSEPDVADLLAWMEMAPLRKD